MTKKTNEPSGWNPVFEFPLDDRNIIIIDGVKYKRVIETQSFKEQYPIQDWEFVEEIETSFNEWFHGDYGLFSYRSEAFYTDCEIGDEKTRQDMLKKWIYASFYEAYQRGRYAKLETEVENDNK